MPGSRLPAYCTSMGRVLLAAQPDDAVRDILKNHPPLRRTDKSITDPAKIIELLARIRADGYAIIDQEIEIGLRSIAVPLFDSRNRIIAALNVGVAAVETEPMALRELYLEKLYQVQQTIKPMMA